MGITVDNAIIDFNTINNIVNTLNTHQDVFTAFEQETLLQATDTTTQSGVVSTPLNVTSVQMASVKANAVVGPNTISFGASFSAPPVVLVSIENSGSVPLIATITNSSSSSTTTSATSTYTGAIVNVAAANGGTPSPIIIIHLLAIGQR